MTRSRQAAERELEIARQIQAGFLPDRLPQPPGWEIAAGFRPAQQVAGDFYDAFPLTHNRRVGLVIADVCDKGVGAALFMALFRTLIRAFAQQHYALRWADVLTEDAPAGRTGGQRALPSTGTSALQNAVSLTNAYIHHNHGESGMFASVFFGVLDPATGALAYVNGGQPPPLLVGGRQIKACLNPTGPVLGILPDAEWEIRQAPLQPGDLLLAYTDGITEARNAFGGFYGEERLRALVCREPFSAHALAEAVAADVQAFAAGAEQSDDITLLAVRRAPGT